MTKSWSELVVCERCCWFWGTWVTVFLSFYLCESRVLAGARLARKQIDERTCTGIAFYRQWCPPLLVKRKSGLVLAHSGLSNHLPDRYYRLKLFLPTKRHAQMTQLKNILWNIHTRPGRKKTKVCHFRKAPKCIFQTKNRITAQWSSWAQLLCTFTNSKTFAQRWRYFP